MNRSFFDIEITKAEVMGMVEKAEYWEGYIKGLKRRFHGKDFCPQAEHEDWLSKINADTPDDMERGRGYRDGYLGIVDLEDPANGIKILRRWRGWSVEDLAEKADVSVDLVMEWEVGRLPTESEKEVLRKLHSE